MSIADLESSAEARVAVLSRFGETSLPSAKTLLQEDDKVHVVVAADSVEALDAALQHREAH
jgi:Trk K+ transport system NAD-binding subunit